MFDGKCGLWVWSEGQGCAGLIPAPAAVWDGWKEGMGTGWAHPEQFQCSFVSFWADWSPIWDIFPTFQLQQIFLSAAWTWGCACPQPHHPGILLAPLFSRSLLGSVVCSHSLCSHQDVSVFPAVPSRPGMCLWDLSQPCVPTQGLSRGPAWRWECRSCSEMGSCPSPPPSSVHPKQPASLIHGQVWNACSVFARFSGH